MPNAPAKTKIAHVHLDGEKRDVPAGPTTVSQLKAELGVDPAAVLFILEGPNKRPLGDHETIDVKSGLRFEAIRGGGVS